MEAPMHTAHDGLEKGSNRACESCRSLKVRCLPTDAISTRCQRCTKANRECVFAAPKKRRPRKRTDTRVAELEKEVRLMRSLLKGRQKESNADGGHEPIPAALPLKSGSHGTNIRLSSTQDDILDEENVTHALDSFKHRAWSEETGHSSQNLYPNSSSKSSNDSPISSPQSLGEPGQETFGAQKSHGIDAVDDGVLSMETASLLFERFKKELMQHYPIVVFPADSKAMDVRMQKPVLFAAVIAAAAGISDQGLYRTLDYRVRQIYAEQIVMNGKKTLELVQAILTTAVWFYPPDHFAELKFYQYIHMASTMALDIGLDKGLKTSLPETSPYTWPTAFGVSSPQSKDVKLSGPEVVECCRTMLGCYFNCASTAVCLRRPNALRFTPHMEKCLSCLESSPYAAPTDKVMAGFVKIQRIAEEAQSTLRLDEPEMAADLADTRVQLTLKGYKKQLDSWKENTAPDILRGTLLVHYQLCRIQLHEVAMHNDHNAEDFRPPYTMESETSESISAPSLAPPFIDAIATIIDSAHSLLDALLAMGPEALRAVPIVNFVRASYAIMILIKLFNSTSSPRSGIGQLIDRDSLKISLYLDRLIMHMMAVAGPGKCRGASKFLAMFVKIQAWFRGKSESAYAKGDNRKQVEPIMPLGALYSLSIQQPGKESEAWEACSALLNGPDEPSQPILANPSHKEPTAADLPNASGRYMFDFPDWASTNQNQSYDAPSNLNSGNGSALPTFPPIPMAFPLVGSESNDMDMASFFNDFDMADGSWVDMTLRQMSDNMDFSQ